jgi:hypothetical protein
MLIPDPDFYPSPIPDPTTAPKEEGQTFFFSPTIFCSHKYHKIVNNLIFEQVKKIFLGETPGIIVLFIQKFVIKLSKLWVWDPGSMLKKAPDTGSATLLFSIHLFFSEPNPF